MNSFNFSAFQDIKQTELKWENPSSYSLETAKIRHSGLVGGGACFFIRVPLLRRKKKKRKRSTIPMQYPVADYVSSRPKTVKHGQSLPTKYTVHGNTLRVCGKGATEL